MRRQEDSKDGDKKEVGARITFNAGGHTHTQYIDTSSGTPVPMVASTPTAVEAKVKNEWQPKIFGRVAAGNNAAGRSYVWLRSPNT